MKKMMILLALLLVFAGCGKTEALPETAVTTTSAPVTQPETQPETTLPPTETEPVSLLGIDLTGLSPDAAYQVVCDTVSCYQLTLEVDGESLIFSADDLHLAVSEDCFYHWLSGQGGTDQILTFQCDQAVYAVEQHFTKAPKNAGITYNDKIGRFVSTADRMGTQVTTSTAESAIRDAARQLLPTATATVTLSPVAPQIRSNDTRLPAAIDAANQYLDISLSLIFEAPGVDKVTEVLSKSTLASFLTVDSNFNVALDTGAVRSYVSSMSAKHGGSLTEGDFVTTYGNTISRTVEYYGATVDQQAMYDDLIRCLKQFRSGSFTVLYQSAETATMPYGGSYVEIDLSSQMLWVYKNGRQVVSTPLVSGDVTSGDWTGVGTFSIYEKDTNCWLVGPTWRDYVYYWIAFNGNIGIHDATWRDEFGGSIYKYNGSHGCINLPLDAARKVYNNVSVGTKVIVYGGSSYVDLMTQSFTGTDSYHLNTQSAPFYLDVTPTYRATEITYTSSDMGVVTVDARGVVTVVGPGSATVTVTSEKIGPLSRAEFNVAITVEVSETEPPTEPPTEAPTEPPTEAPTEPPTEAPTEVPTEETTPAATPAF